MKGMMYTYFNNLPLTDRLYLLAMGTCGDRISFPHHELALYSVAEFFFEVYYSGESDELLLIVIADDIALEKYLSEITLPSYLLTA